MPSFKIEETKAEKPTTTRRSTFQKMLDLERKGKMNRMQSSTTLPIALSTPSLPQASVQHPNHKPALRDTGRAMSTLALSNNIPTQANQKKYVIKGGDAVPEEDLGDGEASEVSSICQSPGWDDLMGSKRKKEKKEAKQRKKERERAEEKALAKAKKEAKHAEKIKNRLTKAPAPPTNKRLSKLGITDTRSKSVPLVPKIPEHLRDAIDTSEDSARRGSVEVGLKDFIQATQAVLVPWRSSHGTPAEPSREASPSDEEPISYRRPTSTEDGFIGGLKLKLADEATTQERIRAKSIVSERRVLDVDEINYDTYLETDASDKYTGASDDEILNHIAIKREGEVLRTPQQWESIYEQAARLIRPDELLSASSSSKQGYKKDRKKTYPPTSYFPVDAFHSPSRKNSLVASDDRNVSRPRSSEDKESDGRRPSSALSSSDPSLNTRDTSVERGITGHGVPGYVGRQRQKSEDISISGYQDEHRASEGATDHHEQPPRGRRTSWTSIRSFGRKSSVDASTVIKPARGSSRATTSAKSVDTVTAVAGDPTQLSRVVMPENCLQNGRSSSKSNLPSMKGFKNAAKIAFSRKTSAPTSPSEAVVIHTEIHPANPGQPRLKRKPSVDVRLSKSERFFGQPVSVSPIDNSFDLRPTSSGYISSDSRSAASRRQPSSILKRFNEHSHSRSATDSSEDYSTFDDSSNITTPMASKAPSEKEHRLRGVDDDQVIDKMGISGLQRQAAIMTNALPAHTSGKELEASPPLMASTLSSKPYTQSPVEAFEVDAQHIHRQPSLSRSVSTPELQHDLSFLPALKHQALKRPPKENDVIKKKGKEPALSLNQDPANKATTTMIKSPPSSPSHSKSEGTSPVGPISSQYLQNARLAMPRQSHRSGIPGPAQGQVGPDPIAKVFVICCSCKYYHDLPSKIYECMARSESVVEDKDLGVRGLVSTSVRCPWCSHGMTTDCCAGYAAIVVLREKLH